MIKRKRYVPNLVSDMAECDANYLRLCQLFPQMNEDDSVEFGIDASDVSASVFSSPGLVKGSNLEFDREADLEAKVEIEICQRCPYTTMLKVTVTNSEDTPWIKWPTMEVRIYHDAKSAEVTSFEEHRNLKFRYAQPNEKMFQPDEKSQINKYLGELLAYCIEHGYCLDVPSFQKE
ncbi:MAG: hypothetical protein ACI9FB_000050 [Candidatus Azotimanducaceae bacterium]|jgi:uncharacterized protein YqiB (DUF1249 family)